MVEVSPVEEGPIFRSPVKKMGACGDQNLIGKNFRFLNTPIKKPVFIRAILDNGANP